jgi:hypothetical protein
MGLDKDFLAMLEAEATLERFDQKDMWGNDSYLAPETIVCFVEPTNREYWVSRQHRSVGRDQLQQTRYITQYQLITDAVGIVPGDKLTVQGGLSYVAQAETTNDEFGQTLYQTVSLTDQKED